MANQYESDPRQTLFLTYYLDPKSETFSNAKQSALRAGYEPHYADSITTKELEWLEEGVGRRKRMLHRAEQRLAEFVDSDDVKIAQDTSKFIAKTLGKNDGYSERTELTGKNGESLTIKVVSYGDNSTL